MNLPVYHYPESPKNINESVTEPSPAFRKEVFSVLSAILLFIFTYIILVIAAIGIAALCTYAGYWLVITIKNLWGVAFGLGFVGLSIMVIYFLFKFVFKKNKIDRSGMIQITEKDQPHLFEFLNRLAFETQTPLPKKVYLSAEVNASVFYDSGFWSMFLPVRKNLNIGLGLVNCVNISEFKAVIAHEFGHFSQKSMKLGSYVYNVNHILHDMLFDNRDYEETLESWGNLYGVFSFFAALTGVIVSVMIRILGKVYSLINKRYMALSRQMEFHADAVAASVSGSSPLVTALYRLDVAQSCYQNVLGYYNSWINENRKGQNIYEHHTFMMKHFAEFHSLPVEHGLIQVSANAFERYNKTRVVIKDQWASHPSNQDREQHLKELNLEGELVKDSAWTLFTNVENLQSEITGNLYKGVMFSDKPLIIDSQRFIELVNDSIRKYSFDKGYKGFYDNREISIFDCDTLARQASDANNLSDILTDETLALELQINGLNTDLQILESIGSDSSSVNSFDFEGKRYDRKDAPAVIKRLKEELKQAKELLVKADQNMFLLFYKKVQQQNKGTEALHLYKNMFDLLRQQESDIKLLNDMIAEASQLFQPNLTEGLVRAVTGNMERDGYEIKKRIREVLNDENYNFYYSAEEGDKLRHFTKDNREFFTGERLNSEAINLYMEALHLFGKIISEKTFEEKKRTLNIQFKVINEEYQLV